MRFFTRTLCEIITVYKVVHSLFDCKSMEKNGNENMTVKDSGAGIVIDNIGADVHTVTLSNLSGQTLSRASVGHGCAVLPAEALPAGGYVVTLHGVDENRTLKLIRHQAFSVARPACLSV